MLQRTSLVTLGVRNRPRAIAFCRGTGWSPHSRSVEGKIAFPDLDGIVIALCSRPKLAVGSLCTTREGGAGSPSPTTPGRAGRGRRGVRRCRCIRRSARSPRGADGVGRMLRRLRRPGWAPVGGRAQSWLATSRRRARRARLISGVAVCAVAATGSASAVSGLTARTCAPTSGDGTAGTGVRCETAPASSRMGRQTRDPQPG